jgi:hypothetical protein
MGEAMKFFVGLHQPSDAKHVSQSFISVHRLANRKSDFEARDWIMDSGAFSTILMHGRYPSPVEEYAKQVMRWKSCGNMLAAVSQDLCEPRMLDIMPVLQGYAPADYIEHIRQYGQRLKHGAWVGVGSVCKRNGKPDAIRNVLLAIKSVRPDLRLHGFGLKTTSLRDPMIRSFLHSADSMAWSFAARKNGRSANSYQEALSFASAVSMEVPQFALPFFMNVIDAAHLSAACI